MASSKKNKKNKSSVSQNKDAKKRKQQTSNLKKKSESSSFSLIATAFFLSIISAFVYKGALDNEFVDWDDYTYVIENNLVRSGTDLAGAVQLKSKKQSLVRSNVSPYTTTVGDVFTTIVALNYHPLTVLTMRWNNNACPTCLYGISARPFILWNVILHIINSILVLLIIYCLSKKNLLISILVAAIFAFHPMHVESVVWVSERKDVLYSFFFLSGLLTYWNYLQHNTKKWLYGTFVLFILSCLSKAMAVVFPLVMLLLYFWNRKSENAIDALKDSLNPVVLIPTLPFFVCSILFGAIAVNVQAGGDFGGLLEKGTSAVALNSFDDFKIMERLQFASYGFLEYIFHFFVPTNLSAFYPYPEKQVFDDSLFFKVVPIITFLILGATFVSLRFTKNIVFGLGFYLITIILVLQFVSVGSVIMADRYSYLPYIGFAFMWAMLIQDFAPEKARKGILIALIIGSCLYIPKTISQIELWKNSDTLWTNVIELNTTEDKHINPTMVQPLGIRGNYYGKQSEKALRLQERQQYLDKAFQDFLLAAKLGSKRADIYEGLGSIYGMRSNIKQEQVQKLQQQNKNQAAQHLLKQVNEDLMLAIKNHSKSIELDSKRGSAYFNRGVSYSILRIHDKAISDYTNTLLYAPEKGAIAYMNRGISYAALKQNKKAIADFQKALQYNPQNNIAQRYLRQLTKK